MVGGRGEQATLCVVEDRVCRGSGSQRGVRGRFGLLGVGVWGSVRPGGGQGIRVVLHRFASARTVRGSSWVRGAIRGQI